MTIKIALTPEYQDDKRHFHSDRLLLILLQKTLTALSGILLTFGGYAPDFLNNQQALPSKHTTPEQRHVDVDANVASTSIRRCFNVVCLLAYETLSKWPQGNTQCMNPEIIKQLSGA